ncbi:MAG: PDZ domain-containing protein, partial [Oligoflexia bacterium]|nr:PDZ domain-containing protein [Oligoflexia bacterium]
EKAFSKKKPGDVVAVTILRMGQKFATEVNLANAPILTKNPPTLPEATVETEASWIGLGLEPMSPAEAQEMNLPDSTAGMVVNAVNNGPAAKTGILIGDIIIGINGKPITGLQAFNAATNDASGALLDIIVGNINESDLLNLPHQFLQSKFLSEIEK